jgi:hypothetical protein
MKPYAAPGVVLLILSVIASAAVLLLVKEASPFTKVTDIRRTLVTFTKTGWMMMQCRRIQLD